MGNYPDWDEVDESELPEGFFGELGQPPLRGLRERLAGAKAITDAVRAHEREKILTVVASHSEDVSSVFEVCDRICAEVEATPATDSGWVPIADVVELVNRLAAEADAQLDRSEGGYREPREFVVVAAEGALEGLRERLVAELGAING